MYLIETLDGCLEVVFPMEKMYDFDQGNPTKAELDEAEASAAQLLQRHRGRAIIASAVFIAACASVSPFLAGNPLHRYWDDIGKYLLLISMGLLPVWVTCVGWALNTWAYTRSLRKLRQ
ncbi:MAG TPA: hypothetical protein VMD92_01175 [Acidobacteriaceae bacterium]|jgi:hypothetical protein|nr:hypothetical protein [Acidobacteriaceae bacterium]